MTITVNVTQDHIDHGEEGECNTCPVALALNEAVPHRAPWKVEDEWLVDAYRKYYPHPTIVNEFIALFDNGETVEPFAFPLEVPDAP